MKKFMKFVLSAIVLQLGCFTSYAQSDSITISLTDKKDSALVPIELLRIANSKMLELKYEKEININLREIIKNDSILIDDVSTLCNYYERKCIEDEKYYTEKIQNLKTQRNVFGGTSTGLLLILLILLL